MITNYLIEPIILSFFTAFVVVLLFTQPLITVSHLKNLVDAPDDERKLHRMSIPSLGGILIFAATIFALFLWFPVEHLSSDGSMEALSNIKYIVATMIVLFFVGVKDDIIGTAAAKKLLAHLAVAFILVLMADIRITSMKGIFGIYELPYWASTLLSIFSYTVIVNAFNLIDGLDGLAAGVGAISATAFGIWFYLLGDLVMAVLAFSLVGALLGFLVFNFSPAQIFMGDSGSLTVGLIMAVLAIQLIEYDAVKIPAYMLTISKPVFVLSCLAYPLVDTLRVFVIRAINKRSPFSADRNHIHHRLIDIGLNHSQSVVFVYLYSLLVIYLSLVINAGPSINFISMAVVAILLLQAPFFVKKKRVSLDKKGAVGAVPAEEIIEKAKEIISN